MRGTPRIANRLLRRVRDFAEVKAAGINSRKSRRGARMLAVDPQDSTRWIEITVTVIENSKGTGRRDSLAAAMSESAATIEDVIEPFLIQQDFDATAAAAWRAQAPMIISDSRRRRMDRDLNLPLSGTSSDGPAPEVFGSIPRLLGRHGGGGWCTTRTT